MDIVWLHDNINDHTELDKYLQNFEKPIVSFIDPISCIGFLTNPNQQKSDRPSIVIILNRVARQIVPEIHSLTKVLFVIIFCVKNDNKIKWISKYNKVRGIYMNPKKLLTCIRQMMKISGLIQPFPCQLVLLIDHLNQMMEKRLHQLDSSLVIFNQINLFLHHLETTIYERPVVLIALNAWGRQIVPEVHSNSRLNAVYIYCRKDNERIKWARCYDKIKLITTDETDLINGIRNEGLCHSPLHWHLVCLSNHNDEALRDRLYELDPCIMIFDQFEICQRYLNRVDQLTVDVKPILFITTNEMGRQFVPEIHSNDRLHSFYILLHSDSPADRRLKWTTKYNKIKHMCTNVEQLIQHIRLGVTSLTNVITKIERRIRSNCIICWLDSDLRQENEDYRPLMTEIHETMDSIQFFIDPDDCIDFITGISEEKVSLIIHVSLAPLVVPLIHEVPQLYTIYMFSATDIETEEEWAKKYTKTKGFFTQVTSIHEQLLGDIHQIDHNAISLSFISLEYSSNDIQSNRLNPLFMYSQLLKEILLDLEYDETSIKDFINYCEKQFDGNDRQLEAIKTIEREYSSKSTVWWYTMESPIYSMLNKALRTLDVETTIMMGFFIRDLHRYLEQLYMVQPIEDRSESFIVYRGQGLPAADFDQIKRSRNGLMSFNSFLSTSRNRLVSLKFAARGLHDSNCIGILFTMIIDASISTTPFAAIKESSRWKLEDEILFSMHTVFRIHDIKLINSRLYEVNLILTGEHDEELQTLTSHLRQEIQGETCFEKLGSLLFELGEYDKSLIIYKKLLDAANLKGDQRKISSICNQLGATYSRKGDFDAALAHYKKSYEIKSTYVSWDDSSLSTILSNIGTVLRNQNQLQEAFEYLERALTIEEQASPSNPLKIASYHNNIGLVLTDQNRHNEALISYEKAFKIQQNYLPPNHPNLATSLNNIGTAYTEIKQHNQALSFYEGAIEIMQRSLPSKHPDLAIPYNNIGSIYDELQQYDKALLYYQKALEIMQKLDPPNYSSLILAYHNLAVTNHRLDCYKKALYYGEKAVEISRHTLTPNNAQRIVCEETLNKIRESF